MCVRVQCGAAPWRLPERRRVSEVFEGECGVFACV